MATYSPNCPSTESGPAFIFSFFSGLPFGPSRPFLFESLFLPFARLPDRSASGKERAGGRWLPQTASARTKSLHGSPEILLYLVPHHPGHLAPLMCPKLRTVDALG